MKVPRLRSPREWWRDLSVSRKLYAVVGVMALLIATELFTLLFAMNILSAVRAFVGGEGLWSKAQKNAVLEIQAYAHTRDPKYYFAYKESIKVPLGDHMAREELGKPLLNFERASQGFKEGRNHPSDIPSMINLMRRFSWVSYLNDAIVIWGQADDSVFKLIGVAEELHTAIESGANDTRVKSLLDRITTINAELTVMEDRFSYTLGRASRWLEQLLMIVLIIAVATVESTGVFLTIAFSRGLSRTLRELQSFATRVGAGDFSNSVPVRSQDELGQLAVALNKMASDLKEITIERQIAERSNQIKSLFLANMSHEIRTPLNAILGFVDLLKDPHLPENERLKYIEVIDRTGNSLATIINDILDISKVEAGKLQVEHSNCSLPQIFKDLESMMRLRCEEKGIYLTFNSLGELPETVSTDGTRLKQILLNVIGNAIKFTSSGGVSVTFGTRGQQLFCVVKDTGVGISPENVSKLFHSFSQVDLSIRKNFGGTGLGLILSKRLAQLMGGDVVLESSDLGKGSTFNIWVTFDRAKLNVVPQIPAEAVGGNGVERPLTGKRVLVVDDSLDNQLLTKEYLLREGATIVVANNGAEAVNRALYDNCDLILMDMQMPVMDGYSATSNLREQGCSLPIIAVTAHAMKEDLVKCIEAGCDDYLSKPFRRDRLINLVSKYCSKCPGPV